MSIAPKRGDTGMTTAEAAGRNTIFAVLTVGLIAMVLCLIPLGVMRWGFMPQDDAMRHVAKAISGRDWSQILFLHEDIKLDTSYGWHALLSLLHNRLDLEKYPLVVFSVSSLFVLFSIVPVLLMKRPEGWVMALLAMNIWAPNVLLRLFLGRPYIISMAVVVAIGCLWERLSEKKNCVGIVSLLAAMIALESWAHSGWYVFFPTGPGPFYGPPTARRSVGLGGGHFGKRRGRGALRPSDHVFCAIGKSRFARFRTFPGPEAFDLQRIAPLRRGGQRGDRGRDGAPMARGPRRLGPPGHR